MGTPPVFAYIARNGAIGFLDRCPPGGHLRAPGGCVDRSVAAQGRALVTHGHADHARGGHGAVLATPETLAIMEMPLRAASRARRSPMARAIRVGEVDVRFVPAGHVLGSRADRARAQGRARRRLGRLQAPPRPDLRAASCRCRATSSSPRRPSACRCSAIPTPAARSTGCSTGSTPIPSAASWSAPMRSARRSGSSPSCARRGHHDPIYIHGALERLCELYAELRRRRSASFAPRPARPRHEMAGQIVIAPPGALNDRWSRRLPDPITAMASGWMRIRQRARQRNVELPLIISDHADWDELTMTIRELEPTRSLDHPRPRGSAQALVHDPPDQGARAEPRRL